MNRFAPPFESFVAPARTSAELWRTGLGFCLALAVYAGLISGALFLVQRLWGGLDPNAGDPWSLLFFLGTFLGMAAGPIVIVRALHHRPVVSLFGRPARVLRDFTIAAVLAGLVFALGLAIWSIRFDASSGLELSQWAQLLPLALVLIVIQTGAEELVFRGYLQQQLAARFTSPLAWMITPSLLFGYAHFDPDIPLATALSIAGATGLFGLFAADLTARTGSIGAAWGLHFANNTVALLLLGTAGSLDGLALFVTPYGLEDPLLRWLILSDVGVLALIWVILRRALAR